MTSGDLNALLRGRYQRPHFILIEEMRDATGFDASRSADAVAIGLYSSRGQNIIGFEVKVSRSDWLRELKNPDKSHDFARYCDFWYIVAPRDLVNEKELPEGWGLLVPTKNGKRLDELVVAPKIAHVKPDRPFLMALIKQAVDREVESIKRSYQPDVIEKDKRAEYQRGYQAGQDSNKDEGSMWKSQHDMMVKNLDEFHKASGININNFTPFAELGAALKTLLIDPHAQTKINTMIIAVERQKFTAQEATRCLEVATDGLRKLSQLILNHNNKPKETTTDETRPC